MAVKPIPDDYPRVTPTLTVQGAGKLIDFIKQTFGAQERMRMPMPDGKIGHAELTIGDSLIMVADASEQWPATPGALHIYVEKCDDIYKKALSAGATSIMEPENMFYGDRSGAVQDQWGNRWSIATHVEDVSEEETMKRIKEMAPA